MEVLEWWVYVVGTVQWVWVVVVDVFEWWVYVVGTVQ